MRQQVPAERGRDRQQRQAGQQPLGRNQGLGPLATLGAVAGVPGHPLTPQRAGVVVPGRGDHGQVVAGRHLVQGPDHDAGGGQLLLHPGDADRRVPGRQPQGLGHFAAVQAARGLLPPQRQQIPVVLVEPAGGLGRLPPLAGQPELQDGQVGEVRLRCVFLRHRGVPGRPSPGWRRTRAPAGSRSPPARTGTPWVRAGPAAPGWPGSGSPGPRHRCRRDRSWPGPRCCTAAAGTPPPPRPALSGRRVARRSPSRCRARSRLASASHFTSVTDRSCRIGDPGLGCG